MKKIGLLAALLVLAGSCACAKDWFEWVKEGNLGEVRSIVGQKPQTVNRKDANGMTALHHAAGRGDDAMVTFLLENGADSNAGNNDGATPLHEAAAGGKDSTARLLLQKGANPNAKKKNGVTPLMVAANFGYIPVGKVLVDEFKADIYAHDNTADHRTALSIAEKANKTAFAEWLKGKMKQPGSILVTVTDDSGKPIANAEVTTGYWGTAGQLTNSSGQATIKDLEPGNYTITASKKGYSTESERTMVPPGGGSSITIKLTPQFGTLSGTFKEGGKAVEGATVTTYPNDYSTQTGPGGEFRFSEVSPNDSYSVVASRPGGEAAIVHNVKVEAGRSKPVALEAAPKPFMGGKLIPVVLLAVVCAAVVGGTVSLARVVSQRFPGRATAAVVEPMPQPIPEPTAEQIAAAEAELPTEVSFAEADPTAVPPPVPTDAGAAEGRAGFADIMGWIGEGMGLALRNVFLLAVMVLLWWILYSLSTACIVLPGVFVGPALLGGAMLVWLGVARGEGAQIGRIFSCFAGGRIWRCMGIYWLVAAILAAASVVSFVVVFTVMHALSERLTQMGTPGVVILAALVYLLFAPMIFVASRLMWAMPLGADRGMGTIDAIKTSWQLTGRVMSGFGTFVFLIALGFVGILLSVLLWGIVFLVFGGSVGALGATAFATGSVSSIFAAIGLPFVLAGLVFVFVWLAFANLMAMPVLVGYRQMIGERSPASVGSPGAAGVAGPRGSAVSISPAAGVYAAGAVVLLILILVLVKVASPDPFVGTWRVAEGSMPGASPLVIARSGGGYVVDSPGGVSNSQLRAGKLTADLVWRYDAKAPVELSREGDRLKGSSTGGWFRDSHYYERN